jgi:type IV pilus assembly protein PilA
VGHALEQRQGALNAGITKRRGLVLPILGAIFVLLLAAVLIPHNMVSRLAHDEASAVSGLRALTSLELGYAAAHPSKGFTCDLAQLKTEVPSTGDHTREGFVFSDQFEGYTFSLTGCEADSEGVVVRYKATAVPALPGKTGVRAFCTDQTGELRFSVNGSPEACRPL